MLTNVNPTTNVRYGVISTSSLDPDVLDILWYVVGKDLTYSDFLANLEKEAEVEADAYEDEVKVEIGETDYHMLSNDQYVERKIEQMWERRGYDSREDYVEAMVEARTSEYAAEEPVIEGEYEGVKYRIDWLGGASLLWVFEGPVGFARSLCSPCIPNAADLGQGMVEDPGWDEDTFPEQFEGWYRSYVVPTSWLCDPRDD